MRKNGQRLLTKSRYKMAIECPAKLFYIGKDKVYANQKNDDPFLKALAQGGFQVEELARMEYPEGVLVECEHYDYDRVLELTNNLLKRENVVIFEAAFVFNDLFIRTDILVKKGDEIQLIEVKAKSFDPKNPYTFVGKFGAIKSGWKSYLFDVAFQEYVIRMSNPNWSITSFLMLADLSKKAEIDGMNQLFRISRNRQNRTGIQKLVTSKDELGASVLSTVNVQEYIVKIQQNNPKFKAEYDFEEGIALFVQKYKEDSKINTELNFTVCKKCEFKCGDETTGLRSGFEECWSNKMGYTTEQLAQANLFEVWNFRNKNLFEVDGLFFLNELTEDNLKVEPKPGIISNTERQWIQIEKSTTNDLTPYILREELEAEMSTWEYPLHMIDFETSTVAIPFYIGMKPYEQVAFQFSHHMIHADGSIEHHSEFIHFEKGAFPNFKFIRALKASLGEKGSIFRYSNHENTILNSIYTQLNESNEVDKEELMTFIQHISHSKKDSTIEWVGARDMIDLCEVYKKYIYLPQTKGSNSIKAVLPAMLSHSAFIQEKYANPIGEINLTSINFDLSQVWLKIENGTIQNPYKLLPPLFSEWSNDQLDELFSDIEDLNNGGAALTAYGYLQYTDISDAEREELRVGLLRYCELDTLAMVMLWEGFREMVE